MKRSILLSESVLIGFILGFIQDMPMQPDFADHEVNTGWFSEFDGEQTSTEERYGNKPRMRKQQNPLPQQYVEKLARL